MLVCVIASDIHFRAFSLALGANLMARMPHKHKRESSSYACNAYSEIKCQQI